MRDRPGVVAVFAGGGTGGHLYPALAISNALEELRPDVHSFFVGALGGLEARVLPELGVDHVLLPVKALVRRAIVSNIGVLWALGRSVARARAEFRRLDPAVVVVTGGYAGAPAGVAAILGGRPLVLQEQNSIPGLTTKLLARWAAEIHVAFPEVAKTLPDGVVRWSGNPVRLPSGIDRADAAADYGLQSEGRILLVVGGSQGSAALNERMIQIVEGLRDGTLTRPDDLQILWQTGAHHVGGVLERLGGDTPKWLCVRGYLDEMPTALGIADLAVSRAGAMTTSEFLAWGIPMVLVPLPTAAADHQSRNAEALEAAGAAVNVPEAGLLGPDLWSRVLELIEDPDRLTAARSAAKGRARPDAAHDIASAVANFLPPTASSSPPSAAGVEP